MEITVRKYVLHCSICLHTDQGNQTILVHRYHNYSARERLVKCDVTQPWLILKNSPSKWCISQSQTALQLYAV